MKISSHGLALVKSFEGCRLQAYQDTGGIWTIGWGHTAPWVREGATCTQEEANAMLTDDIAERAEAFVRRGVAVPLNQNQYDALVSFIFNIGGAAFLRSTLLRLLNMAMYTAAVHQFDLWVHDAAGQIQPGLQRRRKTEAALFSALPV